MEIMDNIDEGRLWELIALLREHCRKHYGFKDNDVIDIDYDSVQFHLYHNAKRYFSISVEKVISKEFGFIQWLVKNKRIDFDKLKPLTGVTEIMLATNCPDRIEVERRYRLYEQLIMLLSISDNPISDLISYLK